MVVSIKETGESTTDLFFFRTVPHLFIGILNVYLALSSFGSTYLIQRKHNDIGVEFKSIHNLSSIKLQCLLQSKSALTSDK